MFIKKLIIEKHDGIIRNIKFHKGLNLIVDETHTENLQETGNNVGKTTVLRLIDFCFGSDGKNIYQDPEFKTKTNTKIEKFLKENNVIITLVLKESLDYRNSTEIVIRRNFLKRKEKIQEINGVQYINNREFEKKLKELIFKTQVEKPTFRQIIAKNIRYEKNRLINTIKVLHPNTRKEEYEALFLFWFGIDTDITARKQRLIEIKKTEEKILQRLKREGNKSEIEQALIVINRDIKRLEEIRKKFDLNEHYKNDLSELNRVKAELNRISTHISKLELRKKMIIESKSELEKEFANINIEQLRTIYKTAQKYIHELQVKFEELVNFHNTMIREKIKYITKDLPKLNYKLRELYAELDKYTKREQELTEQLIKKGVIKGLEEIIEKLNYKYEQKGRYEEQLKQWNIVEDNLNRINSELDDINKGISLFDKELTEKIKAFNKFFSEISDCLYGEQFILSYDKSEGIYELKISSIGGNLGTGKKKGQIAAFDLAYILFCEEYDIPCLHFIIHDQVENIHGNQLKTIADITSEINCQFITPILRDKIPKGLEVERYEILSLSQENKLFKIA